MPDSALQPWSPAERESFFAAIARHRGAAVRVDILARCCALVLALVVAILMSPLFYGALGLALDLTNLVVPMPDLLKQVTDAVTAIIDNPEQLTLGRGLYLAGIAALPGLGLMGLVIRTLGRVMRESMSVEAGGFAGRAPDRSVLAEQQFANVIEEMATAAGLPPPRVLITDSETVNATVCGEDESSALILATTGLLATVGRSELQGVAGHLVGSIANGDLSIGNRIATLLGLFGLTAKLSGSFADRESARRFAALLRASFRRGGSAADGELALALTNPFGEQPATTTDVSTESGKIPWRTIAWMPLVGPLVISGFFGGMLSGFVLGPLLAVVWRRRKYLADATAVRLTRDPDALASALGKMRGLPAAGAFSAWLAHLSVVPDTRMKAASLFGGSAVQMSPALDRRLKALGVMGAAVELKDARRMPLWAWGVLTPLGLLVVGLMGTALVLLVYVSVALSGMFTWLPVLLVHTLLR